MIHVRYYMNDTPVLAFHTPHDWLPAVGDFVRFSTDSDAPAFLVQTIVLIYAKEERRIERMDVAISTAHPGNIPPFPQITRAPSDLVPIPSLEPPEEKKSAET
jgi:hypothetical protein